jgi:hypothetical protein
MNMEKHVRYHIFTLKTPNEHEKSCLFQQFIQLQRADSQRLRCHAPHPATLGSRNGRLDVTMRRSMTMNDNE